MRLKSWAICPTCQRSKHKLPSPGVPHASPLHHLCNTKSTGLFFFFLINCPLYLFMAVLGLHLCPGFFSVYREQGYPPGAADWLLLSQSMVSRVHELQQLKHVGSVGWLPGSITVVLGLSYCLAHGIFPDQGSNPCLPHRQADSLPLSHQGSPSTRFYWWNYSIRLQLSSTPPPQTHTHSPPNLTVHLGNH